MPVHKYGLHAKHNRADLVDVIAEELRADMHNRPSSQVDPPEIFIEEQKDFRGSTYMHVWVMWDKWRDVLETQRAGIIIDAFEAAGRKADVERITVAMGLTHEEADALGIVRS